MFEFIRAGVSLVFNSDSFPARWYCGSWTPLHGWTHIIADLLIASAYLAIPLVIFSFALRRRDFPFPRIFWLFGAFIIACGLTHLIEAVIFWEPVYRLSALAKVCTATVSWVTVISLIEIVPQALRYPGLEAMNTKLKRANDDLEAFANIVSHDLRAPLRGIMRISDQLEESIEHDPAAAREQLELLRNRARKLDTLINGILIYSKAGEGHSPLTNVDVRAVIEDVKLSLTPEERRLVEIRGTFPTLHADGVQVFQILQNLIENALRYRPDSKDRVSITAQSTSALHRFVVENQSRIFTPEDQLRLFQIFRQDDSSDVGYPGLGLAIARKVLEKNGGRIWLETRHDGGYRIVFTWPIHRHPARVAASHIQPASLIDPIEPA